MSYILRFIPKILEMYYPPWSLTIWRKDQNKLSKIFQFITLECTCYYKLEGYVIGMQIYLMTKIVYDSANISVMWQTQVSAAHKLCHVTNHHQILVQTHLWSHCVSCWMIHLLVQALVHVKSLVPVHLLHHVTRHHQILVQTHL
jgi:hypothetical protein